MKERCYQQGNVANVLGVKPTSERLQWAYISYFPNWGRLNLEDELMRKRKSHELLIHNPEALFNNIIFQMVHSYLNRNTFEVLATHVIGVKIKFMYPTREVYSDMQRYSDYTQTLILPEFHMFFWHNISLSFATCSPVEESLTFSGYMTPFDKWTWVNLFISFILVTIALKFTSTRSVILTCYAILLDNSYSTPKSITGRGLIILRTFAIFILSSMYRSIVTNDIVAPLSAQIPSTVGELINHEFRFVDVCPLTKRKDTCTEIIQLILNELVTGSLSHNITKRFSYNELRIPDTVLLYRICFYEYGVRRKHPRMSLCNQTDDNIFPCSENDITSWYRSLKDFPEFEVLSNYLYYEIFATYSMSNVTRTIALEQLAYCQKTAIIAWTHQIDATTGRVLGRNSPLKRRPYKTTYQRYVVTKEEICDCYEAKPRSGWRCN
ncbi:hypothetical protein Fcan01_28484 [Folsomia candida]|uniref:Uncharacterized protein n=1 Tax=Folsomia candida TaxID=158441 RepID=A0A226CW54_FOLCA|nr:hypothetical protein Fcan01_28484 [Folsomia candida]